MEKEKTKEEKLQSIFEVLSQVNVNDYVKEKNGLSYLAWTFAWAEVKKRFPDASYKIWKDEQHRPYIFDEKLGYMCFVSVTILGETHEMWLPVMDGANKAQKDIPYTYEVKDWDAINAAKKKAEKDGLPYGEIKKISIMKDKSVEAATMFDINTTIMRCFVKCLAMFGMGHYIYAGESIPESLVDITGLVKVAVDDISEHENEKGLIKIWADSKLLHKEPDFLEAFIDAAGKYLEGCKEEKDLKAQWALFKDAVGTNENYLAILRKEQGRVIKSLKSK